IDDQHTHGLCYCSHLLFLFGLLLLSPLSAEVQCVACGDQYHENDEHDDYWRTDDKFLLNPCFSAGSHLVLYHCFWASASDLTFWGLLFGEKTSILLIAAFLGMSRVSIEGVIYGRNNLERSGDGLLFYNG